MLKTRSQSPEAMDDLALNGETLHQTLDGLSIINKFLGNTWATLQAFRQEFVQQSGDVQRVVDLGCGGGDNLRTIANWCNKNGKKVQLSGIDGNQNILDYAKQKNGNHASIEYKQADILDPQYELEPCDILISSHFMYHFTDEELIDFIEKAKKRVTKAIIFSELHRSFLSFLLFKIFGRFMPFSRMVKEDGLIAIQRSFKREELKHILKNAGVISYSLSWKWAFRYLLVIRLS
jgi:2-polyprenyl-3-methyl-5-hydroxy-6-metoxy-1,4-benzoquinol methylase